MANVDRKWLPPILIAGAVAASVATYGKLPAVLELNLDGLLPFPSPQPPDAVPRWIALFMVPALAFVV